MARTGLSWACRGHRETRKEDVSTTRVNIQRGFTRRDIRVHRTTINTADQFINPQQVSESVHFYRHSITVGVQLTISTHDDCADAVLTGFLYWCSAATFQRKKYFVCNTSTLPIWNQYFLQHLTLRNINLFFRCLNTSSRTGTSNDFKHIDQFDQRIRIDWFNETGSVSSPHGSSGSLGAQSESVV